MRQKSCLLMQSSSPVKHAAFRFSVRKKCHKKKDRKKMAPG